MTFGENLQHIRSKFSLTQEQLAEQLDVSRQSISKWESGASFPEMDKILQICEIFKVSMDDLMRGDVQREFAADNANYDAHMNAFSRAIALGVGLILLGVSLLLFAGSVGVSETGSVLILMLFIIAAVPIFIVYGIRHEEFCKKHPYIENFYTRDELDAWERKFPIFIAAPVAAILAGVVLLIASDELNSAVFRGSSFPVADFVRSESFPVAIFMLIVAVATSVLVYGGIQKSKYDIEEYNISNFNPDNGDIPEAARRKYARHRNPVSERICGCIMLLATAIFLLMGFVWNLWTISWVCFPVGGILCGVVSVAMETTRE